MKSTINSARYIPPFCDSHEENIEGKCEVFFSKNPVAGKFYVVGYCGRSKKHVFYYAYPYESAMRAKIDSFVSNCVSAQQAKKEQKQKQKEDNANIIVKVGDIFCDSWGYDQTNIDFYQVVKVSGKSAHIKRIKSKHVAGSEGFMSCRVVPDKNNFTNDEVIVKRIQCYGSKAYFSSKYGSMQATTETNEHYCSWYA